MRLKWKAFFFPVGHSPPNWSLRVFDCVLIVNDDDALIESLELLLHSESHRLLSADGAASAFDRLQDSAVDAIFCAAGLPGLDGFDLIRQLAKRAPEVPIILTTAGDAEDLAKQAMTRGAYDYLVQPSAPEDFKLCLRRARHQAKLRNQNRLLERDVSSTRGGQAIVAASDKMIALLELLERIAGYGSSVLVTGERGTGKEVIARAVHAQSPRREAPFIAVPCGAIPENRLEAELFGHTSGAVAGSHMASRGLFAEANTGTLFIDEVSALSLGMQLKLLHAIQEEEIRPVGETKALKVDVRIIAATSRDLELEMSQGRFREDLFYRLDVVRLHVPPLRDRKEDLPLLVDHFRSHFQQRLGNDVRSVSDDALEFLLAYAWPGNVRELENMIERAMILSQGESVERSAFPQIAFSEMIDDERRFALKRARQGFEAKLIRRALDRTQGNRTHAAKLLEISHRALLYKLKDYGIRD
jgi:two-component system response regulator AtoC